MSDMIVVKQCRALVVSQFEFQQRIETVGGKRVMPF
jgi:hypothetical protein